VAANLDAFIAARRALPFVYFEQDCAHIAADWVLAKTGTDPLADLRVPADAPRSLLALMRQVREAGGLAAMANERLGPAIAPLLAQRGDVVLVASGRPIGRVSGFTFGICTGPNIVVPDTDGLVFWPISAGVHAWRV
jgi:hypothetical protein